MAENLEDPDIDFLSLENPSRDKKRKGPPRSDDALADAVVAKLITSEIADKLEGDIAVSLVIDVPDHDWLIALHRAVKLRFPKLRGKSYLESRAARTSQESSHIAFLHGGDPILSISTSIDHLVPAPILQSADIVLRVEEIGRNSVAAAILAVTGKRIRKLEPSDYTGLGFAALAACIRVGTTPAQCRRRMIESRRRMHDGTVAAPDPGPSIAELPLLPAVKDWAERTLVAMGAMEDKEISVSDAPFTLLEGPPGSGKTLLASALARSAGWNFMSTSISAWFANKEGHLGDVTKAAAEFFDTLLSSKRPVVALLDELDALPDRKTMSGQHMEWWAPIITGALLQIDKLRKAETPVLLLAATNFADRIDEALVRPGRLGVHVTVGNPQTETEAAEIFRFYLRDAVTDDQLSTLGRIALSSPSLTPAQINGWVATARALAIHAREELAFAHVMTTIVGEDVRTPAQLYRAAIHEAGHAIIAKLHDIPVSCVSIVRGAGIGGQMIADFGAVIPDRIRVEAMVRTLLAGRAADLEILGISDAGAAEDLAMATSVLSDALLKYGLYDQLAVFISSALGLDATSRRIVEEKLQALYHEVRALVVERRDDIEILAKKLVEVRVLTGDMLM